MNKILVEIRSVDRSTGIHLFDSLVSTMQVLQDLLAEGNRKKGPITEEENRTNRNKHIAVLVEGEKL